MRRSGGLGIAAVAAASSACVSWRLRRGACEGVILVVIGRRRHRGRDAPDVASYAARCGGLVSSNRAARLMSSPGGHGYERFHLRRVREVGLVFVRDWRTQMGRGDTACVVVDGQTARGRRAGEALGSVRIEWARERRCRRRGVQTSTLETRELRTRVRDKCGKHRLWCRTRGMREEGVEASVEASREDPSLLCPPIFNEDIFLASKRRSRGRL